MSEAIIHPSLHRGPPATRVRWRPEVALAGVAEQHPQSAVHKLEGSECEFGQVFLQFVCEIEQMSFHRHVCLVRSFSTFF